MSAASSIAAFLVALAAAPAGATVCPVHPRINRIPTLRAHVDFPVDFQATLRQTCGSVQWAAIVRPFGFRIDTTGGRFYWTPAFPGIERITLQVTQTNETGVGSRTKRFKAIVDDNTLTYPLFRDYLAQPATVPIQGRAHGTYTLEYADQATPTVRLPIAGPITTPVDTTGLLADWDIRDLPDGGRYVLYLTTKPGRSLVTNPVIIDRSALPGWPKRVEAIAESIVLGDLDDDGIDEVLVVTLPGSLYAWRIDGMELFEVEQVGTAQAAPSIGDIDGDGRPEVVWTTEKASLRAHRLDGTLLPGFPTPFDNSRSTRAPLTLADLDGDGVLDIVQVSRDPGGVSSIRVYTYESGGLVSLAGWPQAFGEPYASSSASVGDLDGDHVPEVIVAGGDRVYAWHADGTPVAGLHGALLAVPITGAETNTGVTGRASSQPAVADLDGDGDLEIVVGSNVLQTNGTPAGGWAGGRPSARNTASAAVGDLDGIPGNGLEVVLAADAWHADGTTLTGWPRTDPLTTAIVGELGSGGLAVIASTRFPGAPGVAAYRFDGAPVAAFPKSLYGFTGDVGAPVIGDFNGDGQVDVAAAITDAAYGGVVAAWNVWAPNHDERHSWPMLGHDLRHTGFYTVPRPNRPTNLAVTADGSGQHLGWLDASAVEESYVVERSPTGAAWTWTATAVLPADSIAWDDLDVGTYRYRVRAERTDPRSGEVISSRPSASAP